MTFRIGELAYVNTLPFRLDPPWVTVSCPSPKRLAQWADEGTIDAGVLPVVEAWRLEDRFSPLPLGIAAKGKAMSVLLFSKRPLSKLEGARIGLTGQSATSVQLLKVLLGVRYGCKVEYRDGFGRSDDARLLIGDEALIPDKRRTSTFPHTTDLAEEWRKWQGAPFVFARWVARTTVPPSLREELVDSLEKALNHFDLHQGEVIAKAARSTGLSPHHLRAYFKGLTYRFGEKEFNSESHFRKLSTSPHPPHCC